LTNLPVPYDPEFAAWQQPLILFTPSHIDPTPLGEDLWDRVVDPYIGRPLHCDRQGNPISMRQWGELRERGLDPDGTYGPNSYVRIAKDTVRDAEISTVWLGMDHGWGFNRLMAEGREEEYRPIIFETMIFGGQYDEACMRYHTEAEARTGHKEAVTDLRAGMTPWWSLGGVENDTWPDAWTMRYPKEEQ
jgi:hypothetical protein